MEKKEIFICEDCGYEGTEKGTCPDCGGRMVPESDLDDELESFDEPVDEGEGSDTLSTEELRKKEEAKTTEEEEDLEDW